MGARRAGRDAIRSCLRARVAAVLILALAWRWGWDNAALGAVLPAWIATMAWQRSHPQPAAWFEMMTMAAALYTTFVAYPFVLHDRARDSRSPHLTAVLASALFFLAA